MIGLTKGELSDCSPATLVLASDKDSLALDSLEISKDVSPNISAKISPVDVRAIPVHADFSNPGSLAQSNTDLTKNLTIG